MKKLFLLLVLACSLIGVQAQKEANYWYFGDYAGVNFGLGVPVALTDGQLTTGEGCSSISSSTGNLLFYTDGSTVWNKNHVVMQNGTGLHGHSSSTQSGLIVPNPSSTDIYYIFTVDARDNNLANGLQYSVVDMSANGGLGMVDASQKNIPLIAPACEKVTAIGNYVGNGFWVITHQWGTNSFYAYEITASGVNTTPVISDVGAVISGDMEYSKGYIKLSPDGETLAIAHNTLRLVEIFDFNTANGQITNPISDYNYVNYGGNDPGGPYGVEFSPDSKKLYIGEWKAGRKIFQYDLNAGTPQQILDSRVMVASVSQSDPPIGALQLGPDNRMYIARRNKDYLSRLNFPNTLGIGCGFEDNAVYLAGRQSTYGLPPFIQSFFNANVEFFYETPACYGDPTQFYLSASVSPDSVFWNFGDYGSGDDNYSYEENPVHLFTDTLNHFVTLKYYLSNNIETIVHGVITHTFPSVDLGADSTFCFIDPVVLDPGPGYASYLWQDGSTGQTLTVDTSGLYWCEITNQYGCPDRDSINLVIGQEPAVEVYADVTLVPYNGTTTVHGSFTGGNGPFSYQWEPAASLTNPNVLEPLTNPLTTTTEFILYVTDESAECTGESSVTVFVTGGPLGVTATASPSILCQGDETVLNALPTGGTGDYTYAWTSTPAGFNSDLQSPTVVPLVNTTYHVVLEDGLSDPVYADVSVLVNEHPQSDAGPDQTINHGTTTFLEGGGSGGSGNYTYSWSPAEWLQQTNIQNPETENITETVVFTLLITDAQTGCVGIEDQVVVNPSGGPLGVTIESSEPNICEGNEVILTAHGFGGNYPEVTYTWTDEYGYSYPSTESITVSPLFPTEYFVTIDDGFNQVQSSFEQGVREGAFFTWPGNVNLIYACPYDTINLLPEPHPDNWNYLWSNGSTENNMKIGSTGIGYDEKHYTLVTETPEGCSYSQSITVIFDFANCNGTPEYAVEPIRIFPNPGNGTFSFQGVNNESWSEMRIYNLQLQQVYYEQIPSSSHQGSKIVRDLSFLTPGIYFVNLSREGVQATGKIVILP